MTGEIRLSPLGLSRESSLSRVPPRPVELRDARYEAEFERHLVLYDIFRSADGTGAIGVGPPLANLEDYVVPAFAQALGSGGAARIQHKRLDRVSELWLSNCGDELAFSPGLFDRPRVPIGPNRQDLFRGKKVALTKSRNNLLAWIRDWAHFNSAVHGCNAVLLYDNASTDYPLAKIRETLRQVPGIEIAVVVAWPYKFGPQGTEKFGPGRVELGLWDSDYCQFGILHHARHRFLGAAHSVLQTDIDELVLSDSGKSVFDLVAASETGYVAFGGRWIESVAAEQPSPPESRRHKHFTFYEVDIIPCSLKWAVAPAKCPDACQWRVHDISRMEPDAAASAGLTYRHFKAINTNWRMERWRPGPPDPSRHRIDAKFLRWRRVFDVAER